MVVRSKEFELALATLYINPDLQILGTCSDTISASSNSYLLTFKDSRVELVALNLGGIALFIYDGVTFRTQRTEYSEMIPLLYWQSIQFKLVLRPISEVESANDRLRDIAVELYKVGLRYERFVKDEFKRHYLTVNRNYELD